MKFLLAAIIIGNWLFMILRGKYKYEIPVKYFFTASSLEEKIKYPQAWQPDYVVMTVWPLSVAAVVFLVKWGGLR